MANWQPTATLVCEIGTDQWTFTIIGRMVKVHHSTEVEDELFARTSFKEALTWSAELVQTLVRQAQLPKGVA